MVEFGNATHVEAWGMNSNWGLGDPCLNLWWGIICDANGSITEIRLLSNGLRGAIPASIEYLSSLTTIKLSSNHLYGTLPSSLQRMSALRWIDLSFNDYESIQLAPPPNLETLLLAWNPLRQLTMTRVPVNLGTLCVHTCWICD
uniref:Leucine-rich repeat-containing N-terminal plant-type domain-containing protein n=1 Tax=Arcella intermedia TaxID=1963864 RepID=A0A6B2LNV5_9EUKA